MKRFRTKAAALLLALALPLVGCAEGYEPAQIPVDHIDTGREDTGPDLADYVNQGLDDAKENGLYHESDYSDIIAGSREPGYGEVDPDRLYTPTDYSDILASGTDGSQNDEDPESSDSSGSSNDSGSSESSGNNGNSGSSGSFGISGSSENSENSENSGDLGNAGTSGSSKDSENQEQHEFIRSEHGPLSQDTMVPWLLKQKYEGEPYIDVHVYEDCFTHDELKMDWPVEYYSELDELGRVGFAFACLDESLMPDEGAERGDISSVYPTGWEQAKYEGIDSGGWLYNRCHLIAWALAGEDANERNLMTGTRYFNVEGMLPFEKQVMEYIDENPENHVLYRATPIYDGDCLLADGLLLEARSVEDAGKLHFCVYIFNVQPGVKLDYKTGKSKLAK